MLALSLWQPWATLVISGAKRIETRSWLWPWSRELTLPCRIAIHAVKNWTAAQDDLCRTEPFRTVLESLGVKTRPPTDRGKLLLPAGLSCGALLGTVELVDCIRVEELDIFWRDDEDVSGAVTALVQRWHGGYPIGHDWKAERAFSNYGPGRWAWLMRDPRRFAQPIPYRGRQRLFRVPNEMVKVTYA